MELKKGGKYNWIGQPERLVYVGKNWSGNGYWHQFEKIAAPEVVWCEVLDDQLSSFEESAAIAQQAEEMLRLIKTIKYLRGIAERGTGSPCPEDVTIEAFVLGYVKSLEQHAEQGRSYREAKP